MRNGEIVGNSGFGTFNHSGGTNSAGTLVLGRLSGSIGTYNLSETGNLTYQSNNALVEFIGYAGKGIISQTGGTNSLFYVGDNLYLGYDAGSAGIYNLSGTGQLSAGAGSTEYVGYSGVGTFTQSGGLNNTTSSIYLGYNSQSTGTYTLSDTGQITASGLRINRGTFMQTGGIFNNSGRLTLGAIGSNSIYNLSGTGQLICSYEEDIGTGGTGIFVQSSGTNSGSITIIIGYEQSSGGTYDLSGTGQLSGSREYLGGSGTGTFNQSGGSNTVLLSLVIADISGSTGTYNLTGGTLIVNNISGGYGVATFNFGGGNVQASGNFTTSLPMTLTGINGDANVNTAGYTVTFSGTLTGIGGLNKVGSNTLTLNGINSFTGNTTITAGTLALGSMGTLASSLISVNSGALLDVSAISGGFILGTLQTLKGSGTVIGNLTVNGIHAPGNSPGIETIRGNYNMLGQLQIELEGTVAGMGYDQVLLPLNGLTNYNVTLGGTLSLDWTGMNR